MTCAKCVHVYRRLCHYQSSVEYLSNLYAVCFISVTVVLADNHMHCITLLTTFPGSFYTHC